jgi:hypothetical protein
MKKLGVRNEGKYTAKIKVNSISLTLKAFQSGDKIKISYQIGDSIYRFRETMFVGIEIKLQVM